MEKVIKIEQLPVKSLRESIEHQKDFYKSELLDMGYFKTPDGKQLYELSLRDLEYIYLKEKAKNR
jgi:hypothetical protein